MRRNRQGWANQGAAANGLSAVRSSVAGIRERTVRSTAVAEAVAELGRLADFARMGIDAISTHILVESSEDESDEQFCAAIESMILQTYRQRPDWLQFSAGARFVLDGRHFREFACYAGSVALMLIQRAERDAGFDRGIVVRANNDGVARVYEIRAGSRRDFRSHELHVG